MLVRIRGACASLRSRIGFQMLSAGSTLGLRAPNLRQRVFDSLDSLHAAAGLCWCVFAALVRLCAAALAFKCFPRGVRWGCAPQTAPKSLRLSGLSSRCGGVGLVRIRAVARVHGKTRPALIYGRAGRAVYRWLQHAPTSRLEPPPSGAESGCVREAERNRHSRREAVWPRALPAYRHCLLCAV